jgi:uncharacterized protein YgfB (UPF0149 family)
MYLTIDKIIESTDTPISAAEAHGIAAGMLCVNSMTTADAWLQEVFSADVDLIESDRLQLLGLFEQTQELLNSGTFEFELFLPDDGMSLAIRLDALRHWCLGYLSGVGFTSTNSDWSGDSAEMLKDIVEFTRVDANADGEEDETALVELHEYIRVGVQVIREELSVSDNNGSSTLH